MSDILYVIALHFISNQYPNHNRGVILSLIDCTLSHVFSIYFQPAAVEELRRWTSSEALGDITVAPDCTARIVSTDGELSDGTMASDDEGVDHKLPSPEEQLHVVALK